MSFFEWVWKILCDNWSLFLIGAGSTMLMALSGTIIGFVLGLGVAIVRTVPVRDGENAFKKTILSVVRWIFTAYIEIFRGTPMIVQASVIYFGLQSAGVNIDTMVAAIMIISINTGAYMAEIIRGGIISIDKGQTEAAHSIGMTHWQTMTKVVLPQAVRNIMPSVGNEFVVNIKDSSVLNVIAVTELYFRAKQAAGANYRYFESYFIIAIIYFVLTFTTTRLLRLIERKMDGPDSFAIFGSQSDSEAEIHIKKER